MDIVSVGCSIGPFIALDTAVVIFLYYSFDRGRMGNKTGTISLICMNFFLETR